MRNLRVGQKAIVYVPWVMHEENGVPTFGTYWEGTVIEKRVFETTLTDPKKVLSYQYVIEKEGFDPCLFHERFVFDESKLGRVRVRGAGDDATLYLSKLVSFAD